VKSHKIALIPGDGIGVAVTEAAWEVLGRAADGAGFKLEGTSFPWSCDFYEKTGAMMPHDGIETLRGFDAILLGAVGWPKRVPDSVSLHGLLLPIRKAFVQYANIRPHRLLPGVEGPLRALSTSSASARTPRANMPAPAGASITARPTRSRSRPRSSRARASSASCVSASSRRVSAAASLLP